MHGTQTQSGPITEVTQSFHQANSATIRISRNIISFGIDWADFDKWEVQYWQQRSADFGRGAPFIQAARCGKQQQRLSRIGW
ncbi:HNH/ENDO VII family nuclease [Pseudomonas sp.]|uniref:HNH/ENDO VII family nuclease n=1 Tax=Pseudomonas sp. TaxID=306 RepID=UPI00338E7419